MVTFGFEQGSESFKVEMYSNKILHGCEQWRMQKFFEGRGGKAYALKHSDEVLCFRKGCVSQVGSRGEASSRWACYGFSWKRLLVIIFD